MVFPGMVYISHPSEYGTLYTRNELERISAVCKEFAMPLFLDGARLGYGLTADTDVTLQDIAKLTDVFYIGGTKCGALFGEAVIINNPDLDQDFRYAIKQHGAMLAKGRLLGLQFLALLNGEDGTLQGMLELANLPYTSTGVAGSAIGMDKIMMKQFFRGAGTLPCLPDCWFTRAMYQQDKNAVLDKVEKELGYPVFVKPANLGSSIGVSRADDREGLTDSLELAFEYDRRVLVEKGFDMFDQMVDSIRESSVKMLLTIELRAAGSAPKREQVAKPTGEGFVPGNGAPGVKGSPKGQPVRVVKIGRNDPCPCGSGLKFKKCTCAQYHPNGNNGGEE